MTNFSFPFVHAASFDLQVPAPEYSFLRNSVFRLFQSAPLFFIHIFMLIIHPIKRAAFKQNKRVLFHSLFLGLLCAQPLSILYIFYLELLFPFFHLAQKQFSDYNMFCRILKELHASPYPRKGCVSSPRVNLFYANTSVCSSLIPHAEAWKKNLLSLGNAIQRTTPSSAKDKY